MNIYKFYFNQLIEAVEKFKSDFKYSFIVEDILKKLTLEPPKNSINEKTVYKILGHNWLEFMKLHF